MKHDKNKSDKPKHMVINGETYRVVDPDVHAVLYAKDKEISDLKAENTELRDIAWNRGAVIGMMEKEIESLTAELKALKSSSGVMRRADLEQVIEELKSAVEILEG